MRNAECQTLNAKCLNIIVGPNKKTVRSKDQTATSNRIVNYAIKKMSR